MGRGHPDLQRRPARAGCLLAGPFSPRRPSAVLPRRNTIANSVTPACIGWMHVSYTLIGVTCQWVGWASSRLLRGRRSDELSALTRERSPPGAIRLYPGARAGRRMPEPRVLRL